MGNTEQQGHYQERDPGKRSNRNRRKLFADQVPQQKSPPEYFFHERRDDDEPHKTQKNRAPIERRSVLKDVRIESDHPRISAEELVRRDPQDEHPHPNGQRKPNTPRRSKFIIAPEPNNERAADHGLGGINPVNRIRKP